MPLTRRQTLRHAAFASAGLMSLPATARSEVDALVAAFAKGRRPQGGDLVLEAPLTADNANAVPVRARLPQAFTDDLWCEEILVIADRNPRPAACRFQFERRMGVADVSTRIRLAESQNVIALARMSDGRVLMQTSQVTVTGGGCGM